MQARERDLGRAREVEAVRLDLVDVRLVGRERAGPDQRLLADEHRRQHRDEALLREPVQGEPVEREREERGVADPVAERAPDIRAARSISKRPISSCSLALVERGRLADAPELAASSSAAPSGTSSFGGFGTRSASRSRSCLGGRELLLGRAQLLLHLLELGQLLRRGLSLDLRPAAELVDPRHERAPALVGLEQRVERVARALALERSANGVRVVPGGLEIDHARECR